MSIQESAFIQTHNNKPAPKFTPIHLVLFEDITSKTNKVTKFIATKLDETTSMVRMVGIESSDSVDKICKDFTSIIEKSNKDLFVEILIPMIKIGKIQNLRFKHK